MVTVSEQYKLEQENNNLKQKLEKIKELPKTYQDTSACEDFQRCIRDLKEILDSQEKE